MKTKVLVLAIALLLAIGLGAVACGEDEPAETTAATEAPATSEASATSEAPATTEAPVTTEAAEPTETINLVFSDHNPPENATAQALQAYAAYIEEHSNGRVEIDVQTGGALYSNQEIFDGVREAGCDAGSYVVDVGDGFYVTNAASLPFILYDGIVDATEKFWALYEGFPAIEQEFTDLGLAIGAMYMMPPVHIHWHADNVVVTHPDDLQGKTLLTLEAYVADWFRILGASMEQPTFPDLFPMIDTRAADGYVQHFPFLGGFDLLDDYKSHTLFGEGGIFMIEIAVIWNKDTWDGLPDDIKQIAIDARQVYLDTAVAGATADLDKAMGIAQEQNHTVTVLTPEQMAPWQEGLAPVYQQWIDEAPDPAVAQQIYDKLRELTE